MKYSLSAYDQYLRTKSGAAYVLCVASTVFIISLLLLVAGYLAYLGFSSVSWDFFTKDPSGELYGRVGGMRQALVGTVILIFIASIVGIPMGMMTGVYLSEYQARGWLATPVRFVCDVLAGVPSIVVGILGYELLVRPLSFWDGWVHLHIYSYHIDFKLMPNGEFNGWAATLALAFIMVPIVARTTEEMLRLVPGSYREAAIGLGATQAQTIVQVVIPAAKGSLVTGVMLAIARVAGETAPLLFTAMGSRFNPVTLNGTFPFVHIEMGPGFPSLTVQIFEYARAPSIDQNRQAWAGILILITLIFILNLAIRFFASKTRSK